MPTIFERFVTEDQQPISFNKSRATNVRLALANFRDEFSRLHLVRRIRTEAKANQATENLLHRDQENSNISVCRR